MDIIKTAVQQAGGGAAVGRAIGKSRATPCKWYKKGMPRTEWTGETQYSALLERMQKKNKVHRDLLVTKKQLLNTRSA